jgi:hypothetical protein
MGSGTEKILRDARWLLLACAACSADQGSAESPTTKPRPTQSGSEVRPAPTTPLAPPAPPAAPEPPALLAPTATEPAPTESANKRTCVTDGDCFPDFCDRGVCGELMARGNYGRECEPPPPPQPKKPEPPLPPGVVRAPKADFGVDICSGYLCIDQRCRSCQSDAECDPGLSTCRHVDGWPGKRCGNYSLTRPAPTNVQPPPPVFPQAPVRRP